MSFYDSLKYYKYANTTGFVRLLCGNECFGLVPPALAHALAQHSDVWVEDENGLSLHPSLDNFDSRSQEVDRTLLALSKDAILPTEPVWISGGTDWLPVGAERKIKPLFKVRRFYTRLLGIAFDSIILHGYEDNGYWTAIRGQEVIHSKGLHDVMSAGCVLIENSIEEELLAEGQSECSLLPEHLPFIQRTNFMQLFSLTKLGTLSNEFFYIYDFNTKDRFIPKPNSYEIDQFILMPLQELENLLIHTKKVTPHMVLTMTDFLLRHKVAQFDQQDQILSLLAETHDFYS
jgi:hypothetical protein